ncbi:MULTISPECIES: hypothetical protein [Pseudanabaena]|uniref:hypothetical protein n=1 Tax=Pseudanabaena TaxID=1152 RepID=UPI002479B768|nr:MULTISPECIES: hypothetical protein [Pseudanabaena]MEA5488024.1 hypothetical protein [Pseudanabaena sp. CCNP1317]WGS71829.1 hypothetical protein OA858_19315 [Pseudanabaena galeata CCNP1313]
MTQRCIADQRGSEFIITGKGGVPANPSDRPTDTGVLDNFGTLPDLSQTTNLTSSATPQPTSTPDVIVEATGWIVNAQNQVVLVAGKTPAQPNIRCPRGCDLNTIQLLDSSRKPILIEIVPELLPTSRS